MQKLLGSKTSGSFCDGKSLFGLLKCVKNGGTMYKTSVQTQMLPETCIISPKLSKIRRYKKL